MSQWFLALKIVVDCSLTGLGIVSAGSGWVHGWTVLLIGLFSSVVFVFAGCFAEAVERPEVLADRRLSDR